MTMQMMTNFVQRSDRSGPSWINGNTSKNRGNVTEETTVSEMFRARGMDYTIEKMPTAVIYQGRDGKKSVLPDGNVRLVRMPYGDGRENDTPYVLGNPVKPNFGIVQNMEIAGMLDPFTKTWPIETAGEFDHGTTVYVGLNAGGSTIGGDEMRDYFVVSDIRDGGHSVNICYTPVRVVCWNTLMMSISAATTRIKLPHKEDVAKDADFFIKFMGEMRGIQTAARERLAIYAETKVNEDEVRQIINAAFPVREKPSKLRAIETMRDINTPTADMSKSDVMAKMEQFNRLDAAAKETGGQSLDEMLHAWEQLRERVQTHRANVYSLYDQERDAHDGRGSMFLAVQAVAEYADWRARDTDESETMAEGSLFGRRADEKNRAVRQVEKMLAGIAN